MLHDRTQGPWRKDRVGKTARAAGLQAVRREPVPYHSQLSAVRCTQGAGIGEKTQGRVFEDRHGGREEVHHQETGRPAGDQAETGVGTGDTAEDELIITGYYRVIAIFQWRFLDNTKTRNVIGQFAEEECSYSSRCENSNIVHGEIC